VYRQNADDDLRFPLPRSTPAPTPSTILSVHLLPPALRAGRIRFWIVRPFVAVGPRRPIQAAVPNAIEPIAASRGDLVEARPGRDASAYGPRRSVRCHG
jgi:hypothetical protein